MTPTDPAALDAALSDLRTHAEHWSRLGLGRKRAMLDGLRPRVAEIAGQWVEAASDAKGLPDGSPLRGEEWMTGPWALASYVAALDRTLAHVEAGTLADLVDGKVRQRDDGQTVVRVYPDGLYDKILASGFAVDVWQEPGVTPATLVSTMATAYQKTPEPAVTLVLGAGNIASIPPLDVLYALYAEGRVVLLKMNPVNEYLGPIFERVFAEFVAGGFLRVAYGGAETGAYLTRHAEVDAIHVTGSAATHDAIVYGTGPEGARRKTADEPQIDTPVTSELGGVSPVVVVPGDWSEPDLRFQAERVVTMRAHNAGFNCIAAQVLVLAEDWPQRDAFLREVRAVMRETASRPHYYPGAADRLAAVDDAYPEAEQIGMHRLFEVPPRPGEVAFQTEVFGAALAVTTLPGGRDAASWLDAAVAFCNDHLMGTLGANVLAHPRTLRQLGSRFEDAVAALRYGTVAVNTWSGVGFGLPQAVWGAFPGHARSDVQSGVGKVHNALLFDQPQKTVVTGPFAPFPRSVLLGERHMTPTPPWFVTNETAEATMRRWTALVTDPSPARLPALLASALRG